MPLSSELIIWISVWKHQISALASFQKFSLSCKELFDFLSTSLLILSQSFSAFFFSTLNWWPRQTYSTQSAKSIMSTAYLELTEVCSNSGSAFNCRSFSYRSVGKSLKFTLTRRKIKSYPFSCFKPSFLNLSQSKSSFSSA